MFTVGSSGTYEEITGLPDKIPPFDPRTGDHYWVTIITYKVDPTKMVEGEKFHMDHENLVMISVPGCFYCEEAYTPRLALRRCRGHG